VNRNFKKLGMDVRIDKTVQITRPELVELGNHIAIDMCTYISCAAKIGDYVHIAPHVCVIGGASALLVMEDFSALAAGSKIICAGDDFRDGFLNPFISLKYRVVINKPIIFKKFSSTGTNCSIMPGVTLAEGSVVGSNSVLTKDTVPWGIYAGCPAKLISERKSELILRGAKEMGY